jgi:hypothetical protein
MVSTRIKLFGKGAYYFEIIDQVLPPTLKHEYAFVRDQLFETWIKSPEFTTRMRNKIVASELVDKAHLAAVAALIRTKKWCEAACIAYDAQNFLMWAAAPSPTHSP